MKIYSMTATFGKLENQTLPLQSGLNILERPNEWGKSTWCAFLVSMLYGIETREKLTANKLPDKERYKPWSGAPMAGKIELCWNGRDITIERHSKTRAFSEFRAYETQTGLDVPELTAANCGMMLLGVERSVFVRAGFLRLAEMPVTQDDAFRRRLNNLVTTGDESQSGDKLAEKLKKLKNECKNKLIPQAEDERDKLEDQLYDLQELNDHAKRIKIRQQELERMITRLENHKIALEYNKAQEASRRVRDAETERDRIRSQLAQQEAECATLPTEAEAEQARQELQRLHSESVSLQMDQQMLPPVPEKPICPKCFAGLNGEQAIRQAQTDYEQAKQAQKKDTLTIVGILVLAAAVLAMVAGIFLQAMFVVGGAVLVVGAALLAIGTMRNRKNKETLRALQVKYETELTELWLTMAEGFAQSLHDHEKALEKHGLLAAELRSRRENMVAQLLELTGGEAVGVCLDKWEQVGNKWKSLAESRRELQWAEGQIEALRTVTKEPPAPTAPDTLTFSLAETEQMLSNALEEQKQNQLRLGEFLGQADMLGQESVMRRKLNQVRSRLEQLENTQAALDMAMQALGSAKSELQRRFAPRIAKRTQELFGKLTDGRYDKVMLTDDLSIETSTQQELTLRNSQWRSDGTIDQLYMALRLAVAEELTPDAPLVLDDVMVRFDDTRLSTALNILQEMAENKQVILFTCQSREKKLQGEA